MKATATPSAKSTNGTPFRSQGKRNNVDAENHANAGKAVDDNEQETVNEQETQQSAAEKETVKPAVFGNNPVNISTEKTENPVNKNSGGEALSPAIQNTTSSPAEKNIPQEENTAQEEKQVLPETANEITPVAPGPATQERPIQSPAQANTQSIASETPRNETMPKETTAVQQVPDPVAAPKVQPVPGNTDAKQVPAPTAVPVPNDKTQDQQAVAPIPPQAESAVPSAQPTATAENIPAAATPAVEANIPQEQEKSDTNPVAAANPAKAATPGDKPAGAEGDKSAEEKSGGEEKDAVAGETVSEEIPQGDLSPEFHTVTELKKLRVEIGQTKVSLKKNTAARKIKIQRAAELEKTRIDQVLNREINTVSGKYDAAVSSVKREVYLKKVRIEKERAKAISRVRYLAYQKKKELDTNVYSKKQQMLRIGKTYGYNIKKYSGEMKTVAYKAYIRQKGELYNEAIRIAKQPKYSGDKEKVALIKEDLVDMGIGTAEVIAKTYGELRSTLDENSDTMAEDFRTEGADSAETLPEGSEEVATKFEQIRDAVIQNISSCGMAEIQQMEDNANQTIADLKKNKKDAIGVLRGHAKKAKQSMGTMADNVRMKLDEYVVKSGETLDKALAEAEKEAPELPDELAATVVANARQTNRQIQSNDVKNGDQTVKQATGEFEKARMAIVNGITGTGKTCVRTARAVVSSYQVFSGKIADAVIGGFKQMEQAADHEMSKANNKFLKGLNSAISEATRKWEQKRLAGEKELRTKTYSVISENQKAVNKTKGEMPGRARYLWMSSRFSRAVDNIGAFISGFLEALWDVVVFLLEILGWILLAIVVIAAVLLLIVGIAALIGPAALGAVLGAIGAAASFIASAAGAIGAFLGFAVLGSSITVGTALLWAGIAIGVGFGAYAIYEAATTKGLSGKDRWKGIGKGFFDIVSSFEFGWVSKVKIFKNGSKMKNWGRLRNFFTSSKAGKKFVVFTNRSVDLASDISNKFAGKIQSLQKMVSSFKNGLHMKVVLNVIGGDAAKLEKLMLLAGEDAALLQKALRQINADALEESMKHYDDLGKMLDDLKKSGGKPDEFVESLRHKTDPVDESLLTAEEKAKLKNRQEPDEEPKKKGEEEPESKKNEKDEAEKMAALAEVRAIVALANISDEPLALVQAELGIVDQQYEVVKSIKYEKEGENTHVWVIGSKLDGGILEGNNEGGKKKKPADSDPEKTNDYLVDPTNGASSELPELGNKLNYIFGKATGSAHNIERSTGMLRQLESIGIFDNAAGNAYLRQHLAEVFNNSKGIIQSNGRYLRESLLMGPNGSVKMESIWEGNKLITMKLIGGKA